MTVLDMFCEDDDRSFDYQISDQHNQSKFRTCVYQVFEVTKVDFFSIGSVRSEETGYIAFRFHEINQLSVINSGLTFHAECDDFGG